MGQRSIVGTSVRALGLALLFASVSSAPAHAQSAEAEALFNDADKLFAAGKLAEACDAFEGSNKLEARAGTLIRLGECREKQGRRASAWSAYRDALSRAKDPVKRQIAQDRVAALEPTLSQVTISVPEASKVPGLEIVRNGSVIDPVLWNRTVPIDGGEYTVIARAPGFVEATQTVTIPVDAGKVSVEIPKLEPVAVVPQVLEPAIVQPDPDPIPEPSMFTGRRKIALGLGVVAVGMVVVGGVLGSGASGLEEDAYLLCPDPSMSCVDAARANDLIERAGTRSSYANIAFGVAAGAAIGAGVLWFLGAPSQAESTQLSLKPHVSPDYAGAVVGGSF